MVLRINLKFIEQFESTYISCSSLIINIAFELNGNLNFQINHTFNNESQKTFYINLCSIKHRQNLKHNFLPPIIHNLKPKNKNCYQLNRIFVTCNHFEIFNCCNQSVIQF